MCAVIGQCIHSGTQHSMRMEIWWQWDEMEIWWWLWDEPFLSLSPLHSTVKGRTNLKIKAKYLSQDSYDLSGHRQGSKGLTVSRSNSSLSLYSSASAPSSPLTRKVNAPPAYPSIKAFVIMILQFLNLFVNWFPCLIAFCDMHMHNWAKLFSQ